MPLKVGARTVFVASITTNAAVLSRWYMLTIVGPRRLPTACEVRRAHPGQPLCRFLVRFENSVGRVHGVDSCSTQLVMTSRRASAACNRKTSKTSTRALHPSLQATTSWSRSAPGEGYVSSCNTTAAPLPRPAGVPKSRKVLIVPSRPNARLRAEEQARRYQLLQPAGRHFDPTRAVPPVAGGQNLPPRPAGRHPVPS